MSLTGRALHVGSEGELCSPDRGSLVEKLRASVYELIPAAEIAVQAAQKPNLAKSEIKGACRQVFQGDAWSGVEPAERARLVRDLLDGMFGFGPLEALLDDESVSEIMVNATQSVYFERAGILHQSPQSFSSDEQVRALIDRIIGPLGRRIDEASPTVDARLPQGHRVHAIIPPLSIDGPVMTIRKFTARVMTLEDMVAGGSLDEQTRRFLDRAVALRKNIAVSGGTGTGKTTLLNALSCKIPNRERIITIEDSAELRFFEHPHVVRLEARAKNAEGVGEVTIRDLVINALRMRPDRIVVGECRGAEALDMLQAMNTGHDGSMTTLHANAPEEAVMRLTTMVRYGADLPVDVIESHIASAIDLMVQIARGADGVRFVSQIAELDHACGHSGCCVKPLFERAHAGVPSSWDAMPSWMDVQPEKTCDAPEVAAWLQPMRSCG